MISERAIRRVIERFSLHVNHTLALHQSEDVQIILDSSVSMTSGDGSKEQRTRELAIVLLQVSARTSRSATLVAVRGAQRDRVIDAGDFARLAHLPFDSANDLVRCWPADLAAPVGLRVVLSDYLFPGDPKCLVERAAAGAARLFLVQLRDPWEIDPQPAGRMQLVDLESEESLEVLLDGRGIENYRRELIALEQSYAQCSAAIGAKWITASSADDLEKICRDHLVPAELLFEVGPIS